MSLVLKVTYASEREAGSKGNTCALFDLFGEVNKLEYYHFISKSFAFNKAGSPIFL
jgi:hypothetical protein